MRTTFAVSCLGAFALVAGMFVGAEASDLATCANVKDDAQRLACYDLIAEEAQEETAGELPAAESDEAAERTRIISRCREEMGEHGSAMVKYCAEKDIAAYRALQRYAKELRLFIERCTREMGPYGWSMIKYCADKDIDAERALNDMMTE